MDSRQAWEPTYVPNPGNPTTVEMLKDRDKFFELLPSEYKVKT